MAQQTVFYFDVLGFSSKAKRGHAEEAVDALQSLADLLGTPAIAQLMGPWSHRYALSDSVFLTHESAEAAVRQAAALVFNLVNMTLSDDVPLLVRGGIAAGEVRHVKGIFLTTNEPANLVGQAVVDAVKMEGSGLKGPRIFLSDRLVKELPRPLVEWLLRPTSLAGTWEVLWLLPSQPSDVARDAGEITTICGRALALLATHGGHESHGDQYRGFLLLAARSAARIAAYVEKGAAVLPPMAPLLTRAGVAAVCERTSGLPDEYVTTLTHVVENVDPR